MKASIVDLRYHMNDVLKALDRNEEVEILYHRKKVGVLSPVKKKSDKKVQEHPFFGMSSSVSVSKAMQQLRGGRYDKNDV